MAPPSSDRVGLPAQPSSAQIPLNDFQELLEAEALRHFEIIQAVATTNPPMASAAITIPGSWQELNGILYKMAYRLDDRDPWRALGFGPFNGPEPTEMDILARTRLAKTLLTLGDDPCWSETDRAQALEATARISEILELCVTGLPGVLRARKQLRGR